MPAKKPTPKATTKSVAPAKAARKAAAPDPVVTKSVAKTAPRKASAAATKKAAPAKAPAAKAKPAVAIEVRFERYSPDSGSVDLVGSFNDWKVGKTPLKRSKDGTWSAKIKLLPGTYEYKFVYDGRFYEPDPAREQVQGPFGANSLLVVA